MNQKINLTGISTTGRPHLGNYAGAIRPAIEASLEKDLGSFYFLADYHSLVKNNNPEEVKKSCMEVAATWLALGLDTKKTYFYRQSDIPEIPELMWILSIFTSKGLMNRAHAYKAATQLNEKSGGSDLDKGISLVKEGLFDSVFSATEETWVPRWVEAGACVKPINWTPKQRPRRQEMPELLIENGAFYITTRDKLLKNNLRYSGKIGCVKLPLKRSFQIDTSEELDLISSLISTGVHID